MQAVRLRGALGSQREAERRQGTAPPPAQGAPAQTALLHVVGAVQSPELVRRPQTASQVVLALPKQLFTEGVIHALNGTAAPAKTAWAATAYIPPCRHPSFRSRRCSCSNVRGADRAGRRLRCRGARRRRGGGRQRRGGDRQDRSRHVVRREPARRDEGAARNVRRPLDRASARPVLRSRGQRVRGARGGDPRRRAAAGAPSAPDRGARAALADDRPRAGGPALGGRGDARRGHVPRAPARRHCTRC